jgi:hypothetical protein
MKHQRQQENVCISPITSIVSLRSFFSLFPLQSSNNKKKGKKEKTRWKTRAGQRAGRMTH